jgi:hypothetical protein
MKGSEFIKLNLKFEILNVGTTRVLKWLTRAKKGPIYTQTRQINYYCHTLNNYEQI